MDTLRVQRELEQLHMRRHQLLILCHAPRVSVLPRLAKQLHFPLISLSLSLSEALLECPHSRQPRVAGMLVERLVSGCGETVVGLHRIELLFLPRLQLDPLRLLEQLSRNKMLVVTWPGHYKGGQLVYAEPWHPEYRRYIETDARIITFEESREEHDEVSRLDSI
ncbi:BREX-3 system P-loop-containing protein BrxF [Kyrpidia tusciae]|uniref:BREX-3 system P-loop-containing protein BrxF n=1 Tax=Kyrpidia tusciae (strain DSM 2912 / NBRC 15312 / T2) TaxID=562970 RepID=D5WT56_KYRT2|nr:BREX-3 system P-loop-containing protein BrxF [Kyrpidia tusciae]ADG05160.1 conserved hypothetical protein [Kyrpidia tusciae DSM 2912]